MKKSPTQRMTHKRPSGEKVQLDHIIAPQAWKGLVQDITANPAIALNSNHYLVTATLNIKRAKASKPSQTQVHNRQPDSTARQAYNALITASMRQLASNHTTDPEPHPPS
jgi:transaldolase